MLGCSHTHGIAWFAFYCGNEETNEIDGNIMFVWTKSRATSCNRLDRAWVWSNDWTSGGVESETLALEFSSRLLASKFKEMFELVKSTSLGRGFWQRESCRGVLASRTVEVPQTVLTDVGALGALRLHSCDLDVIRHSAVVGCWFRWSG